jgi:hypothetical protein
VPFPPASGVWLELRSSETPGYQGAGAFPGFLKKWAAQGRISELFAVRAATFQEKFPERHDFAGVRWIGPGARKEITFWTEASLFFMLSGLLT